MSPCLNFDIQVEILKRLPVKSLIRFRSVCKTWKSLIDSSRFIAGDHNDESDEHLMVRYGVGYGKESEVKYDCFVDDDNFPQNKFASPPPVPPIVASLHGCRIIDSSCGLVCLGGSLPPLENGSSKTDMVVLWNPSIRKSIAIVVPNDNVPSRFSPFVGFGVCPETKDPKLVNISYNDDDQNRVTVFTLSSREWRSLPNNQLPRKSLKLTNSRQTVIGRFLYRLAFDGEFYLILSFDLSTNEFREIPLPGRLDPSYLSISKLRESLVLIDYDGGDSTTPEHIDVCVVWMMMEDGEFTKLFTITNEGVDMVMGFKKTGEPLVQIQSPYDVHNLLAVYEPCLDHIKVLWICRGASFYSMCYYNESLLLLDHDDGIIVRAVEN